MAETPSLDQVRARLNEVIDPCSAAAGARLSVLDMGLVRAIDIEGSQVTVCLRLTSPGCMMVPYFIREVEERIGALPGVGSVVCRTDLGLEWEPSMMTPLAVERLAE